MKAYVAQKEKQRHVLNPDKPKDYWAGTWEYTGEWEVVGNRHTNLALYSTPRTAITTNWGTDKSERHVRVYLLDTDDLEPVSCDLQTRIEWAERMMLKCAAIMAEAEQQAKAGAA